MVRLCSLSATLVFGVVGAGAAQNIPATVAAAEAEGAAYQRGPMPGTVSWAFREPFGGTAERKCVAVVPDASTPGASLRSGDLHHPFGVALVGMAARERELQGLLASATHAG